ncbi:MAG: transglycosylase SLT domain-containing protein [Bilophila wadsworthia]
MDIYALSPHAAALSLPRMVSPQLVLRAHAGKGMPSARRLAGTRGPPAAATGLDPRLIAAVIKVESNFETIAESEKGAQGLMQLMPGTQQMLGVIDPRSRRPMDAGSRYLRQQIDRFGRL